ncbi:YjbF family lipoprotein [Photobacterium japonica]|uniref:YjbF family lipoprotein n=1 Tax=Photobacterium japonica TaxID=2910235 RepID=UPI003D0AB2AE
MPTAQPAALSALRSRLYRLMLGSCLLSAPLLLSGCSQKFNDVNDTMQLALFGNADATLSVDDVNNLPYASLYASIDDGPQAFMVLALAETAPTYAHSAENAVANTAPPILKWLSSDKGMLQTQSGRVVKTLNLPQGNVVALRSTETDPLQLGLQRADTPRSWQRQIDWQPGYHTGYQALSHFTQHDNQVILVNQHPIDTLYFTEEVSVTALDATYTNAFWLHPSTGRVIKSRQKLAPNLPYVDITVLKPFFATGQAQ